MSISVLHVNGEATWRGGERQLHLLLSYTGTLWNNALVCKKGGELDLRSKNLNIKRCHLGLRSSINIDSAWKLARLCQRENIDVLHCHTPKAHAVGAISTIFGNTAKLIVTKRTTFPISDNAFSRWKYRRAQHVICVSKAAEEVVLQSVPTAKTIVIPSAIERAGEVERIPYMDLTGLEEKPFVIGYAAAFTSEKNPEGFLRVADKVLKTQSNIVFVWIGDGPLRKDLIDRVRKMGLAKLILLPGFQNNPLEWINSFDILFFPSLSEGFPTTLLNAMQCDVPVVASNVGGIVEIIENGITGMLVEPEDHDGFAKALLALMANDELRHGITSMAKEKLEGYYIEKTVQQLDTLYRN